MYRIANVDRVILLMHPGSRQGHFQGQLSGLRKLDRAQPFLDDRTIEMERRATAVESNEAYRRVGHSLNGNDG